MKKILIVMSLTGFIFCFSCKSRDSKKTTQSVNTFIGTGGHGHTYPGATLPFGMVQLSPDTRLEGWDGCSAYHYTDSVIYGFSHTHLSGTGVSDYGDVLLMPIQGEITFDNGNTNPGVTGYSSPFQKKNENAEPGFYEVRLDRHNIDVRLSCTNRVGIHEYGFDKKESSHIILDLSHRDKLISDSIGIISNTELVGHRISSAWANEQHVYFAIQFSKAFEKSTPDSSGTKMALSFDLTPGEKLMVKVGISGVNIDGAKKNLVSEAKHWDFDAYRDQAQNQWEAALSKIKIEDSNKEKKSIFYTALYHSMIAPNLFSDVDGRYRGMDREIHQADHPVYTVFSLWDTYRATHPLFTILEQKRTNDFIKTFLKQYRDGGILPIWELAGNYTGCMIGYHAIPVIADAYLKGISEYDGALALEAMVHSARQEKLGLSAYKNKGYIGMADEAESVSKTLEYAYDDWCIAQMAMTLGEDQIYQEFIQRSQFYKNLFNPANGFMQSKMNGAWSHGFDPAEVNFNFTEANSWQYSMYAPHDIAGLIELYGGKDKFEEKLDELFSTSTQLSGREQADITGLIGQYAHGNEPSHHMAYLYNYIGKAHKTQQRVNQILNELYTNQPDGLSGNEDCGQMSSWYMLSSLGFYPVTPGMDYYTIGSPQFEQATINLENGNQFTIKCIRNSKQSQYIQSAELNGNEYNLSYLSHTDLMKGGEMVFELGTKPNSQWATNGIPISKIEDEVKIVAVPYFTSSSQTFTDSLLIEIKSTNNTDKIYYSLNNKPFLEYHEAFFIKDDALISTYAQNGAKKSFVIGDLSFKKIKGGRSIELLSGYSNQYSAGGDNGLIDYLKGGNNFRTGYWQGYFGEDFEAILSLKEIEPINKISLGALQDIKSWIWFPKTVGFSYSKNGKSFFPLDVITNDFPEDEYGSFTKDFSLELNKTIQAKFIKVVAKNYGTCPDWHLGDGNPSWLFFDEITIE